MIKDQLTSSVAGIILSHVRRERGRLTAVSDMCGINCREFTRKGLSGMRLHRFLRVVYALALLLDYKELCRMAGEVLKCILDFANTYDETLLTESMSKKHFVK